MPFQKNRRENTWARLADESVANKLLTQGCLLMSQPISLNSKGMSVVLQWSFGVERMLRIFTSMEAIDRTGIRPKFTNSSKNSMLKLEDDLFERIERWLDNGPGWESYPGKIYAAVAESVNWRELLTVLDVSVREFRTNPEELIVQISGEVESVRVAPRDILAEFHAKLFAEPHVMSRYSPTMPLSEFNVLANEVDQRISKMVLDWWFMMTRLATYGAFGEDAKKIGTQLAPGKLPDGTVAPLSKIRPLKLYSA